ncbi:polyamine ABC transporter permease [Mycolicibacterium wolinskyi]|uniref:Polyamine ABC transporter permease n=1 Tax=Mycolicibacterium wolinskyi TaxID=59750 RepID=A0A132PQS9_9MYCO|nr:ABC transporter permease [Mycolicibacterium wolinskyi]KWX24655.1 polyamine ABC transporter permease [Mycolicibacterium wolinskyi]
MNRRTRVRLPLALFATLVGLLLVAPTLIVIPLSFTDRRSFMFPNEGWSLRWYERFFSDQRWLGALGTSLTIGVATALLATVVGTLAAVALNRARLRVGPAAQGLLMLPIVIPGIVAAVAIFGSYLGWGMSGTYLGLIVAHTVLAIPFVVIPVNTALQGLDPTLERAASVLGAGPWGRFWQVQLPLLAPAIATGFVFAFVTSLDEVVVSYFLQSPTVRTLPVQMYSSVTVETDPAIAVASTLVLVFSTAIILLPRLVTVLRTRAAASSKEKP